MRSFTTISRPMLYVVVLALVMYLTAAVVLMVTKPLAVQVVDGDNAGAVSYGKVFGKSAWTLLQVPLVLAVNYFM